MRPRSVFSIYAFLVALAFAFHPWQSMAIHAQTEAPKLAPFTLASASDEEERPASQIFAEISPAIAFIETPAGTGSGALIEHGYLLTNAHVVWPFESVRVVFPDGSEYPDAPVRAWDTVADLALVGPIDTDIEPIPLVDEPELDIGSVVYLIGYPAEVEEFPQPTITSGILSRIRTWDAIDYSFYQVDATTTGGQSGGIMVAPNGDPIGISTFYYSGFGLAGSVADAFPRLNAMLAADDDAVDQLKKTADGTAGNTTDGAADEVTEPILLGDRPFPNAEGKLEHHGLLSDDLDMDVYVLRAPVGDEVEVTVEGRGRPQMVARPIFFDSVATTEPTDPNSQSASMKFTVEADIPYFVLVFQLSPNRNSYTLTSSHPLTIYQDPDDDHILGSRDSYMGALGTIFDVDRYRLFLTTGRPVEITVDSLAVDPAVILINQSGSKEELIADDNSGGGLFGTSAKIVYEAPAMGYYELLVTNGENAATGSYFIQVEEAPEDAELTPAGYSRDLTQTDYGPMAQYESDQNGFSISYPADWATLDPKECGPNVTFCVANEESALLLVEDPLSELPKDERNLAGYTQLAQDFMDLDPSVDRGDPVEVTTLQGLPAVRMDFDISLARLSGDQFIFVDDKGETAFKATFFTSDNARSQMEPMVDYVFDTFRYWADADEESAAYYLDKGTTLASLNDAEAAIEAYSKSIELDSELMDAYWGRGTLHLQLGNVEEAQADFDRATALEPENAGLFGGLGRLMWMAKKNEQALAYIDQAIELDGKRAEYYNTRALIEASLFDFDQALADVEQALALSGETPPPDFQETRGYIYVKMNDFESAKEDYDAVFDQDHRTPQALLGAGVAYANLGDVETARALIEEGFDRLDEEEYNLIGFVSDPQLFDLTGMADRVLSKMEATKTTP